MQKANYLYPIYRSYIRRLGCHGSPIAAHCFAGATHVVTQALQVVLVLQQRCPLDANFKHLQLQDVYERAALNSVRPTPYVGLFTADTNIVQSFFARPEHLWLFQYVTDLSFLDFTHLPLPYVCHTCHK